MRHLAQRDRSLVDLGGPGYRQSSALDIESHGRVVGWTSNVGDDQELAVWYEGRIQRLDGSKWSIFSDLRINDSGDIAGIGHRQDPSGRWSEAELFAIFGGRRYELELVSLFDAFSIMGAAVSGVHDSGLVLGGFEPYWDCNSCRMGFVWNPRTKSIDFLGTFPVGIDTDGTIICAEFVEGVLYSPETFEEFSARSWNQFVEPRHRTVSGARAMNRAGHIVGYDESGGFLVRDNVRISLKAEPSQDIAFLATDINLQDQVVGWMIPLIDHQEVWAEAWGETEDVVDVLTGERIQVYTSTQRSVYVDRRLELTPAIWDHGQVHYLEAPLHVASEFIYPMHQYLDFDGFGTWIDTFSSLPKLSINDAGQVAGTVRSSAGEHRAFVYQL